MRPALIFLLLCAAPGNAWAAWLEGRSPNFLAYSEGSEAELRTSLTELENHHRLLRQLTRKTPAPGAPLKVYLVATREQLAEAVGPRRGAGGAYVTGVGGTVMVALRGGHGDVGGEQLLRHEYTHHFMMRHDTGYYPLWYAEGFAEYLMTATVEGNAAQVGHPNAMRMTQLARGKWVPMTRLLFETRLAPDEGLQFYAQSWLFVHYLFADEKRRAALEAYLAALARGVEAPAAFAQAFGHGAEALDAELQRYAAKGPAAATLTLAAAPSPAIAVSELPAAADQLLLPHLIATLSAPGSNAGKALLERVKREAARHADDPYASRVLARAEAVHGDRGEAVRLTELLLKEAPQDAELLFVRGLADYATGRLQPAARPEHYRAARPWFEQALKADPFLYTAAYLLADCEMAGGAVEQAIEHLLLAQSQAPMASDMAMTTATLLVRRGRHAEARRILTPIAANPQWDSGRRAREMLESLPGNTRE